MESWEKERERKKEEKMKFLRKCLKFATNTIGISKVESIFKIKK